MYNANVYFNLFLLNLWFWSESDNLNLFFHFKESYETFSFFMLMFTVQFRIFLFLALAFKEFSFTIANANVYVNLFLFHLRSEILIIEGYYTKYPNPTISFFHFKESYETFSFSCSNLSLSSPYIYIQRIFLHHHHR